MNLMFSIEGISDSVNVDVSLVRKFYTFINSF